MLRVIRILLAMLIAAVAATAAHAALGLDGAVGELADLGLLLAAALLTSLSDRELFWAVPKSKRAKQRTRITA
jgi:hypothetical protein